MKKISVASEIEMYIFMLEEAKKKVYTNYEDLQKDLKSEFQIDVKITDIEKVYYPILEEEVEDLQLIYKNVFSW
jgi:predicted choloylglycine hydrolase